MHFVHSKRVQNKKENLIARLRTLSGIEVLTGWVY